MTELTYYQKNKEKILAYHTTWCEANKEKREEWSKSYYVKNKEKILERQRAYRESNREKLAEGQRIYRKNNKKKLSEEQKARMVAKRYGISLEDVAKMKTDQCNKCAICQKDIGRLVVDHNHDTGEVRGLLCNKCNIALGLFKDSRFILLAAVDYLDKH
jgi:hypothetical protein